MPTALAEASAHNTETISARFATFAAGANYDALPVDVQAKARAVLLDTLGCALAGSATEEAQMVAAAGKAAAGEGASLVWGTSARLPLPFAALANGTAAHAREMDDFEGCLHSGAVIIPAALGAALHAGVSGRELLTAIVVGYDIARRVLEGCGGNLPLKRRGWHSTSLTGGFGAAAAVGRILGLDATRMQWAIGIAGSTSGGSWAFNRDGAASKRIHPGLAAQNGTMAAYLAQGGMVGPEAIFEAEWGGFFALYAGDDATPDRATQDLGADYRIRLVGVKPYAACRGNHSSIDAILELRATEHFNAHDVERIIVRGNRLHVLQLGRRQVRTTMEAQFSLPYSIAVALVTGRATLEQYSPAALRRSDVLALAERIEVIVDPAIGEGEQPVVEVHLTDGRVYTKRVPIARGDRRNPLSEDDLRVKFRANAAEAFDTARIAELEAAIDAVAELADVRELGRLLEHQL